MWIQVSSSYFVAGLKARDSIIFEAAPILKFMEGWTLGRVKTYCQEKGWDCICV